MPSSIRITLHKDIKRQTCTRSFPSLDIVQQQYQKHTQAPLRSTILCPKDSHCLSFQKPHVSPDISSEQTSRRLTSNHESARKARTGIIASFSDREPRPSIEQPPPSNPTRTNSPDDDCKWLGTLNLSMPTYWIFTLTRRFIARPSTVWLLVNGFDSP